MAEVASSRIGSPQRAGGQSAKFWSEAEVPGFCCFRWVKLQVGCD